MASLAATAKHQPKSFSLISLEVNIKYSQPQNPTTPGAYTKGEIKHLTRWFPPQVAVITGITAQHLELFGSIENIIKAKSELPRAIPKNGKIIINGFNPETIKVVQEGGKTDYIDSSLPISVPIQPTTKKQKKQSAQLKYTTNNDGYLTLQYSNKSIPTKILGTHYSENIQTAITTATHMGISIKDAINSLKTFNPPEQFIQKTITESLVQVIDDGATTNPTGFHAAIDIAKSIKSPNKILLTSGIIDLGSESNIIHKKLAKRARPIFQKVFHLGIDGKSQFQREFKNDFISNPGQIKRELAVLSPNSLIIIEGKIKQEILKAIK